MKKVVGFISLFLLIFSLYACMGTSVTFDYMGLDHNVRVSVNDGVVTKPTNVSVDGYIFVGWYQDDAHTLPFDFSQTIDANTTIYGYFVTEDDYISNILPMTHASSDVYYEIFVRSFADSNGDGIGDLNGVTANLDYLESLGITAIWLMPINPSPSYHGYDVTDYYGINPDYGTLADFENLIQEADQRGIDIIIDLVVNHTSDQHPWYISASSSVDSPYRDWYIFPPGSNNGYESFVGGMKDLNYDNPAVNQEMKNIMAFYIDKGVHGFRLDAVTKIFEYGAAHRDVDLDAALLINGWDTYIKTLDPNAYIVSEAWYQSYVDYADYYIGSDSLFDFNLQTEIMNRVGAGQSTYLFVNKAIDMFEAYKAYRPDFIDGVILGNHDMDRIASRNGFNSYNSLEKLKLAAAIQLTLPGNPFIYYGEEIAMKGWRDYSQDGFILPGYGIVYDEVRRTPFIWGNSSYQTSWFPANYDNEDTVDVQTQMTQADSLWTHYQTLIALRKANPALMYGNQMTAFKDNNSPIQGYIRYYEDDQYRQAILVIHNMYATEQTVSLTGDYTVLYGSTTLPMYGTLIVQIDPDHIGDYS